MLKKTLAALVALPLVLNGTALAQVTKSEQQDASKPQSEDNLPPQSDGAGNVSTAPVGSDPNMVSSTPPVGAVGKQPSRILGIIPNFKSVSADTQLPPLSVKDKFKLATKDSFDYGSVIVAGLLAGVSQAHNSVPEFHHGAAGYGRYFWRSYVDQVSGNYLAEAIVPSLTREDPRYYTLGHGSILHRTGYAASRIVITRTDSNHRTFNISEILGNGLGAAVSNLYYPQSQRTWIKTRQKWTTQVATDGLLNILKEFWPDIDAHLFKQH